MENSAGRGRKLTAETVVDTRALTNADSGGVFDNIGATGETAFILPPNPVEGCSYTYAVEVAQSLVINADPKHRIYYDGASPGIVRFDFLLAVVGARLELYFPQGSLARSYQ